MASSLSSSQQLQWETAQKLSFSLDLVAAAKSELNFLAQVPKHPELFDPRVLGRAVERYEFCWLPLANSAGPDSGLVPPLDCAWIWHCHKLNPVQYAGDCNRLFGTLVEVQHSWDLSKKQSSSKTWDKWFPRESYNLDLSGDMNSKYTGEQRRISYDLVDAALRQKHFFYQVSEPHYCDSSLLAAAEQRYKGFIHLLHQQSSGFLVPTYDIDLIWHAHQLDSRCYKNDIREAFGKVLNHDDRDGDRNSGGKLDMGFKETCKLWETTYGFPYEKAGCMYRGEPGDTPTTSFILSSSLSDWVNSQKTHLALRRITKVRFSVRGVRELSDNKKLSCFVAMKALKNNEPFIFQTKQGAANWNQTWTFESELSTEGVLLQLRTPRRRYSVSRVFSDYKVLGDLVIRWTKLMDSQMQSLNGWFPLENTEPGAQLFIQVFISATPAVTGPYLLRSVRARDTGEDQATFYSHKKGMWITKTVHDHLNDEVFVTRTRYKRGGFLSFKNLLPGEKIIQVHRGGWTYNFSTSNSGMVSGDVLASAMELESSDNNHRIWSMLGGTVLLTVRKDPKDSGWNMRPVLEIEGDYPMKLLPQRRFQFKSRHGSEAGFVTMITYSDDAPQGRVGGLFNWKSGMMQIEPTENVLLVVLLLEAIAISVSDLLEKEIVSTMKRRQLAMDDRRKASDHLGAVRVLAGAGLEIGVANGDDGSHAWWSTDTFSGGSCGAGNCGSGDGGGGGCGGGD